MESLSTNQYLSGNDIFANETVSIDQVRQMTKASDKLFCRLSDNKIMTFGDYAIRDYDTRETLVEVGAEMQKAVHEMALSLEDAGLATLEERTISYNFGSKFFDYRNLSLKLNFNIISEEPVKNLVLVERHYFRDRLLINFEFKFPFCMPKSSNDCEFIYDLPEISDQEKQEMIDNPWETKSDSFFFHEGKLIIHNKAAYSYQD